MKISKSKQELARIISENGGWRDGAESAAQCVGGEISFWSNTARKDRGEDWCGSYLGKKYDIEFAEVKIANWHRALLSRAEYLHLYPVPDADGWIEWKGGECPVADGDHVDFVGNNYYGSDQAAGGLDWSNITQYRLLGPGFCESVMRTTPELEAKPTIEQLAADYRNAKDYAELKQQEVDAAKADAEAKLAELIDAGEVLGLRVSPIAKKVTHSNAHCKSADPYKGDAW